MNQQEKCSLILLPTESKESALTAPHLNRFKYFTVLPQGTVICPLLFNNYVLDMRQTIAPTCQIIHNADDTMLYTTNEDFNEACSDLEKPY